MGNVVLLIVDCSRAEHLQLQWQERVDYTVVGGTKGVDTKYQRPAV